MQVWAVLKPGFLAFLEDPLDVKLLDIIIFDLLPSSSNEKVYLAHETKSRKPLQHAFKVCFQRSTEESEVDPCLICCDLVTTWWSVIFVEDHTIVNFNKKLNFVKEPTQPKT